MEFAIPVDPATFRTYYPTVTQTVVAATPKTKYKVTLQDPGGSLNSELDRWVTDLKNEDPSYTTCCIQMSHAINMAFYTSDPTKMVGASSGTAQDARVPDRRGSQPGVPLSRVGRRDEGVPRDDIRRRRGYLPPRQ